jgi:hypothetical protein
LVPPDAIIADAAREQKSLELRKFCSEIGTTLRVLEEGTPWANKAELYIGLIKEAVRKDMKASDCPIVFWDYCVERRARINNLTAKDNFKLHGSNAYTLLTGAEGDISNMCQYGWYDWCYYREQKAKFPFNREVLGRVLGPAKGEGNEMAQWILKENENVVPRRTVRPLQVDEVHSPTEIKKREIFDDLIERIWGTSINPPKVEDENENDCVPCRYFSFRVCYDNPRMGAMINLFRTAVAKFTRLRVTTHLEVSSIIWSKSLVYSSSSLLAQGRAVINERHTDLFLVFSKALIWNTNIT